MAPIVRSSSQSNAASGTNSQNTPKPAGLAVGDLLLAFHSGDADADVNGLTPPTGWTTYFGQQGIPSANVPPAKLHSKIADANDVAATSFTFGDTPLAPATACDSSIILVAIQAGTFNATTPIFVGPTWAQATSGSTVTNAHPAPSVNGINDGLLLTFHCADTSGTARTYTPPTGMTEVAEESGGTGSYILIGLNRLDLTAGGATGSKTATCSANTRWTCGSLVVNPATSGSTSKTSSDNFSLGTETASVFALTPKAALDSFSLSTESAAISTPRTATDTFALGTETAVVFALTTKTATDTFAFTDTRTGFVPTVKASDTFGFTDNKRLGFAAENTSIVVPKDVQIFTHPVRVIAQSIRTKEFLSWDLPLQEVTITYTLSGAQIIKGIFRNEVSELRDAKIVPWGTWIHIEDQGVIRASGILQPFSELGYDEELTIEAFGPSSYPTGLPFLGEASYVQTDPKVIIADIWNHLQVRDDAKLGVVVRGQTSAKVGKPLPPEPPEGQEDTNPDDNNDKPFQLVWWEAPDCGDVIQSLVREFGFDFVERQEWNATKTDVLHYIDVADQIGTRRFDLAFIEGENIRSGAKLEERADMYVSEVWAFGAGEGREIIKGYYGSPNVTGRIRRVYILQDQTIKTVQQANLEAKYEYLRRQAFNDISDLDVDARHDNAPLGSYDVGDDIIVDALVPWLGDIRQWERILSITFDTETDTVTVSIRRAETFANGS